MEPSFFTQIQPQGNEAERALFAGEIDALVATLHENERPLAGLSGLLDWHLCGVISETLKRGVLTGRAGECAYFPIQKQGRVIHLFLVGAGASAQPGERRPLAAETLLTLKKNLVSMKLNRIGISRSDVGDIPKVKLEKSLEGVPLWIAP